MTDQELGDNIRKIRELRGISQQFLADALEISQKNISRIENGQSSPTFNSLIKICDVLDVDLKVILDFDEKFVFNNIINNQNGTVGEFIAYNNTEVEKLEKLYEKLLIEKDEMIQLLKTRV